MPIIDPENGYLTVLNLFKTDAPQHKERLVKEMKAIVNTAAFPGWISSTVHRGEDNLGTLNFIQWRSAADLEARYSADTFKHSTVPVFVEITTHVRLMQTEVVNTQRHPSLAVTEVSPDRDDYTVAEIFDTAPDNQSPLIDALGSAHEWLVDTPGYRSQSILRGVRARGPEGQPGGNLRALGADNSFVVLYSQWDSKQAYDAFRRVPDEDKHAARQAVESKRYALSVSIDWNTYRPVHSRSATQPVAV